MNDHDDVGGPGGDADGGDDAKKQKGKTTGIADYLSAPRKKRKSFVVLAMGKGMRAEIPAAITSFVRANFKTLAISQAKTADELRKQFARQIVLLIFDDEFVELEEGLALIEELKQKRASGVVPVLFMTRSPDVLIQAYNQKLLPFHEADEYLNYPKLPITHVLAKVRSGLTNRNRRRSRRYKVDTPITYYSLTENKQLPGRILDLSIHGALVRSEEGNLFRMGDQLKLQLPTNGYLSPVEGDYLKISARVRRVFISGNLAGISFEHVTEKQLVLLVKYLTEMVNSQTVRRTLAAKGRTNARS